MHSVTPVFIYEMLPLINLESVFSFGEESYNLVCGSEGCIYVSFLSFCTHPLRGIEYLVADLFIQYNPRLGCDLCDVLKISPFSEQLG